MTRFYGTTLETNGITGEITMYSNLNMKPIFKAVIPDIDLRMQVEKGIRAAEREALSMAASQCKEAITSLSNGTHI